MHLVSSQTDHGRPRNKQKHKICVVRRKLSLPSTVSQGFLPGIAVNTVFRFVLFFVFRFVLFSVVLGVVLVVLVVAFFLVVSVVALPLLLLLPRKPPRGPPKPPPAPPQAPPEPTRVLSTRELVTTEYSLQPCLSKIDSFSMRRLSTCRRITLKL